MTRRSLGAAAGGLLLLAAALPTWAGPYDTRDWAKYPPIVERDQPVTLWEIGDIHGDYERLLRLLLTARIIPAKPAAPERAAWSGGNSALVVCGDTIDKGPRPMDVLRFLHSLQAAARSQGGEVIVLSGNHEAELLAPTGGETKDRIADWGRLGVSLSDLRACKGDIGTFLCSLPFGARVGEWFFSHAGNTGGRTIRQISAGIEDSTYKLMDPNSILEARLGEGKEWIAADAKGGEKQLLTSYAAALGVKHMVQGHQHNNVKFDDGVERHTGEMFQRWGLLFLTDVGMSREIGDSQGALLRITQADATAVCPDGKETLLWDAKSGADVGRAAPCAH
jgi:hypothetical protein